MKKRLVSISTITVVAVFLVVFAVSCFAFKTDGNLTYQLNASNDSYTVVCCSSAATGEIKIPEVFKSMPVTAIARAAFSESDGVTQVTVPASVTFIDEYALGYQKTDEGFTKRSDFIVSGAIGSTAQSYASENELSFKVHLTAPVLKSALSSTDGVHISWNSVNDAKGYAIYRRTGKTGWKKLAEAINPGTKYTDATAESGNKYTYTVKAVCGSERSDYDHSGISVYYLAAPRITSVKNTFGGAKITWTKCNGAANYRIYKRLNSDKGWTRIAVLGDALTVTDKTAVSGSSCYYTVVAYNGSERSSFFNNTVNLYLSEPVISSVYNEKNAITVKWNAVSGAKSYRIYHRTPGKGWEKLADVSSSKLNYTDSAVKAGTKYIYTVKAFSGKASSSYQSGTSVIRLNEPTLKSVSSVNGGLKITWNSVSGATGYNVYRANGNGGWKKIGSVKSSTDFTDKSLKSAGLFTYTVRAYNGSNLSSFNKSGKSNYFVPAPVLLSARCVKSTVSIKWEKVENVTGYYVYRKVAGGKYSIIATVKGADTTTYSDRGAAAGKTYVYALTAYSLTNARSGVSNKIKLYVIDPKKPMVALTYDDGPYTPATNKILDVLEKYNAHATFFVVGSRADEYSACIKRASSLGCEIGNHTYNHVSLSSASASTIKNELSKTNNKIKSITGIAPTIMRPPGGAFNSAVKSNCSMPMIIWSVDTLDWKTHNTDKTIAAVKSNVKDGSIVLMHDLYVPTANAAETIVPWLIKQGYQLVTVSEMMDAKGIKMNGGTAYYSAS